jgi:hypothetical protein
MQKLIKNTKFIYFLFGILVGYISLFFYDQTLILLEPWALFLYNIFGRPISSVLYYLSEASIIFLVATLFFWKMLQKDNKVPILKYFLSYLVGVVLFFVIMLFWTVTSLY